MKIYLKFINPIVSLIVLIMCLYASTVDKKEFNILAPFEEGAFPAYFFAKGLFCSSALFILGRILYKMLYGNEKKQGEQSDG
jgi:hypothetical protein